MDATRGTRKSHSRNGCRKGATKPPEAPSTCMGTSWPLVCCTWSSASLISLTGS